ncbi:RHS repeat-associated core domain-containing protein [Granulicella sp. 5B5]|uniref:RHS repeat-associated core domain-containing protein n=1 Tax=Granulicella sp. 5B5 TaxID=1617967 RepID=UPI001C715548|nr:RHS repeat-associated core domain-containing protein [Granulicella sp. 5B5]
MSASTTNNRNQLSSASYDAAGDVIQENGVGYTYDAEGRLINGSGTAYTYDGMGERVVKGGSKLYWKGVGSTALTETNQQGASLSRYIFFNGQRIAREDANPGCGSGFTPPRYYVTDNVGSTALVTDSIGDVLNESLFFPYGVERIISQNDTGNNYKFSGKERDPETGLDDFGARYYESALGRFMTPDWDAKPITVPYAKFGDPQTLNLYSYVENGPVNRVDADGHDGAQASISAPQEPVGHCGSAGGDANCLPILASQLMHGGYGLLTFLANVEAESQQAAASTGNNVAPPPPPPASATAQQQNSTQRSKSAAEAHAKGNMQKYGGSQPADKGLNVSPVAGSCGGSNHTCQYSLSGAGSEGLYVYEHQTSGVLGGQQVGDSDYVTPGHGYKANTGIFYDDIGGSSLDTYRFFTVSKSPTYNPADQMLQR